MQQQKSNDFYHTNLFQEIKDKVFSMSAVHEQLLLSKEIDKINLSDFLSTLLNNLSRSYEKSVQVIIEKENIFIDITKGIPLGLIANEIITNSYKHAFGLSKDYFSEEGPNQSIIFILNEKFDIDFKKNSQYICAETLSSFDSLALNKDSGIPCLAHECLLYNHTNELILVDKNITFNTIKLDQELA